MRNEEGVFVAIETVEDVQDSTIIMKFQEVKIKNYHGGEDDKKIKK